MSEYQIVTVIAGFVFAYSLVASRLEKTPINGALVYVFFGLLFGPHGLSLVDLEVDGAMIRRLAEGALAICLFTDAASANLVVLRRVEMLSARLLLLGLPLTFVCGLCLAWLMFEGLGWFELALLATILAPTDAALGKAVVSNRVVPDRVRESLNLESGLNDGICVPLVLIFLSLSTGEGDTAQSTWWLLTLPLTVIGIGLAVGLGVASIGGLLLSKFSKLGWNSGTWLQFPVIALALLCFALAQLLGGSGFIACFVGGLIFGTIATVHKQQFLEEAEGTADAVTLITWFAFGTVMLDLLLPAFSLSILLYAILSLTIIRMLPVFLCLVGKGLHGDTRIFIGWFGPRGLASIVFLVMVVDQKLPGEQTIVAAAMWTILLSVLLHGLTANPIASLYGTRVQHRGGDI